jgi:hypothetical protein
LRRVIADAGGLPGPARENRVQAGRRAQVRQQALQQVLRLSRADRGRDDLPPVVACPGACGGKGLVREAEAKVGQDVFLAAGKRLNLASHGEELIGCPLIALLRRLLPRLLGGGYSRQRVLKVAERRVEPVNAVAELASLRPRQAEPATELVTDAEQLAGELAALPCPAAERAREVRHAAGDGEQDQQQYDRHEHLPARRSR